MKEKLKSLWGYAIGTFMVSNIIMIWFQGGGRYSYNGNVTLIFNLIISTIITIIVTFMVGIEEFKRK